MNVSDYVHITKSVINSVNKKFKNPCKSLIYRGLRFKVVVPPAPQKNLCSLLVDLLEDRRF